MKRLYLSLAALIGSVVLFIIASFAWFTVSEYVNLPWLDFGVDNFDIQYEILESEDDLTYSLVEDISFDSLMPGQTLYYQINISNQQDRFVNAEVYFIGFSDIYSDGTPSTSEYSLKDAIFFTSEVNSQVILNEQLLSNLLIDQTNHETAKISVSNVFTIEPLSTTTLYFQITVDESIGNEYQNLGVDIGDIYISLDQVDGS
ncbi:MAG: hypothetical protein PF513_04190 [Tenericutes bacterium]|jgi:hypothetical protein|nr:hypothetical protein [Mycoplasmatota bacterium]